MTYKANDYSKLFTMKGFSRPLLENHFKLYEGYVKNTNKLLETLAKAEKEGSDPEFAELKRRLGWEFDGMRLHEFYFNNLGGTSPLKKSPLQKAIDTHFGTYDEWLKDFKATSSMRGIGWAILYFDPHADRLMNTWINEHAAGHFAGCSPILVLDAFEHAYMLDYGVERAGYIDAFITNIRWDTVADRFELARQSTAASVV